MANQQRSVIVTAIVLAIILGGALVWLLNRTPADQLATQAPASSEAPAAADDLVPVGETGATTDGELFAQAPTQQPAGDAQGTPAPLSPTDTQTGSDGQVQGVAATAPTGPADMFLILAVAAAALGSGGLLALLLPSLEIFRG